MKRLLILLSILICFAIGGSASAISLIGSGIESVAGKTYLLQDDFEDDDGVNLFSHTMDTPAATWDGSDVNNIEIDTAQKNTGTSSTLRNGSDSNAVYKVFTKQTAGKHTYDLYFRTASVVESECDFLILSDGAFVWNTNFALIIGIDTDDLAYSNGITWVTIEAACFSVDTWYHIEIEVDIDNEIFDVFLNNVEVGSDIALHVNDPVTADIDRARISDSTDSNAMWLDDFEVYTGARQ